MRVKKPAYEARLDTLEKELKNAEAEAERPFPKEDELREKSARLNQLNRELSKPGKQSKDKDDDEQDLEDGSTPVREPSGPSGPGGGKPSIRAAIRSYTPPAPVPPGADKGHRREAAL